MRITKRRMCNDIEPIIGKVSSYEPIVYGGMCNQSTVVMFNDCFEHDTINKLINDIESIRQIGGYSSIDIYFTSMGGVADTLFVLSDYLNNIDDIHINFIVNGMVASCGFYILLLIDNENIDLIFNSCCSGLIHLGDVYISARGQLVAEEGRYNIDKFYAEDLKRLNDYLKNELIHKLNLSKKDIKQLEQGKDVMFHKDELEKIVMDFRNRRYYQSEKAIEDYAGLLHKAHELNESLEKMQENYKKYNDRDIDEILKGEIVAMSKNDLED